MPNPEHLAILKKGVEEWNAWREEHASDPPPDLSLVDLAGVNLHGADLSWVDFGGTDLRRSNLSETDLSLTRFINANLSDARLVGAYLMSTVLSSVDLRRSDLRFATFQRAKFLNVDLTDATLGLTVFAGVGLSTCTGLELIKHDGPSSVGMDTIERSIPLPYVFMRGCGFSDEAIASLGYINQRQALELYSCFISYSSKDEGFAERLWADLQSSGVRCWFAPHDVRIGDRPLIKIDEAIRLRDKVILVLSAASIESDWVEHEVNRALDEEQRRGVDVLMPLRIDDAVMTCEFGWAKRLREAHKPTGRHIGTFCKWKDHDTYKVALDRLLRDLKAEPKA